MYAWKKVHIQNNAEFLSFFCLTDDWLSCDCILWWVHRCSYLDCSAPKDGVSLEDFVIFKKHNRTSFSTPLDVSKLRHSSRSTRFEGFKAPFGTDPRRRSFIKPCHSFLAPDGSHLPLAGPPTASLYRLALPPLPTPIPVLQYIGVSCCGIPASELSNERLL